MQETIRFINVLDLVKVVKGISLFDIETRWLMIIRYKTIASIEMLIWENGIGIFPSTNSAKVVVIATITNSATKQDILIL